MEQDRARAESRENLGGFGAVADRKDGCASACSGCGGQGGVRLPFATGRNFRFGGGRRLRSNGSGVCGDAGVRLFLDANQALIGNFPAEVAVFAALLEILLEEDGTAGIGHENTGSGQKNIASAILHFHTTPEEG